MVCRRKGGDHCYAEQGDNRYHSIFGGVRMGTTACRAACPAGTDISAYMEQVRLGNFAGAAQIIMDVNPMPMITSRVCAHFCQAACNQNGHGESVAIRNVESATSASTSWSMPTSSMWPPRRAPASACGRHRLRPRRPVRGLLSAYGRQRRGGL